MGIIKTSKLDKNKRVIDWTVLDSKDMGIARELKIFGTELNIRGKGKLINNGLIMTNSDISTKAWVSDGDS